MKERFNPARGKVAAKVAPFLVVPLIFVGCGKTENQTSTTVSENTTVISHTIITNQEASPDPLTTLKTTTTEKKSTPRPETTLITKVTETSISTSTTLDPTTTETTVKVEGGNAYAFEGLVLNIPLDQLAPVVITKAEVTQNTPSIQELTDEFADVRSESSFRGKPYSAEFMIEKVVRKFYSRFDSLGAFDIQIGGNNSDCIFKGIMSGVVLSGKEVLFAVQDKDGKNVVFAIGEQSILEPSLLDSTDTSSKIMDLISQGKQISKMLGIRQGDPVVFGIDVDLSGGEQVISESGYPVIGSIVVPGN